MFTGLELKLTSTRLVKFAKSSMASTSYMRLSYKSKISRRGILKCKSVVLIRPTSRIVNCFIWNMSGKALTSARSLSVKHELIYRVSRFAQWCKNLRSPV